MTWLKFASLKSPINQAKINNLYFCFEFWAKLKKNLNLQESNKNFNAEKYQFIFFSVFT